MEENNACPKADCLLPRRTDTFKVYQLLSFKLIGPLISVYIYHRLKHKFVLDGNGIRVDAHARSKTSS